MFFLKIWFSILVVAIPVMLMAQDETAPLIEKMQQAKGNAKVDLLNEISVAYRKSDRLASMHYARDAFRLATSANYLPGKALALKNEGICWFFMGNNDSARICYTQALGIFTRINDQKGVSACHNNLGLIAQETGRYDEALEQYRLSAEMDHKLGDDIGVALTLENMADIHLYLGKAQKALTLTNQCIAIYTRHDYKPGLMASYINRGAEFDYMMKFNESVSNYTAALKLARELKDVYYEIMANSNLGLTYWHMGKPDVAMQYLNTALGMSDENDDAYNIDNTLKTIAQIYTSQKQYVKANDILQRVLKRNEESENERQAAAIMTSIGRNLIELNEIDKALGYLNKSLEVTTRLNAPYEMLENYRNLAHADAILHNFRAADSLQDLFAETYSKILNSDSLSEIKKEKTTRVKENVLASSLADWLTAIFLLALVLATSVIAFRRDIHQD